MEPRFIHLQKEKHFTKNNFLAIFKIEQRRHGEKCQTDLLNALNE